MTTDLEDLVRSTLREHASGIDSGPRWDGATPRTPHHWPVIAAAAAVVLVVCAGAAWWIGKPGPDVAGGDGPVACDASLPAAWRAALEGPAYRLGDYTPPLDGVLADGSAVAQPVNRGYGNALLSITPAGAVQVLYRPPAGYYASTTDLNGRWVVANIPTESRHHPVTVGGHRSSVTTEGPGTADIVAVDSRTRHVTHLLAGAPSALRPTGPRAAEAVGPAVVQGDTVYWTVDGDASRRGVVVGYDLVTHHYRRIADYTGTNAVERDGRGVFWRGGSVPRPHLPAPVARLAARTSGGRSFDDTYVVTDGRDYAWNDRHHVHWAGPDAERVYRVDGLDSRGPALYSVAGRFVLMFTGENDATYHVLDTRTGALADTGIAPGGSVAGTGSMLYLVRPTGPGHDETIPIDTARLPGLHCSNGG